MGAFGEYAGEFLDHGIPVVPTSGDDGKRPCIRNWQKIGITYSTKLAKCGRFDDANLAILPGTNSGLTVLDVDDPDPMVLNSALARFGETPIVIKTGSGNYQAWYKHNGERRMIRPIKGISLDILGGGICVAPPSRRPDKGGASYEWIQGDLNDIDHLPCLENLPLPQPRNDKAVSQGSRTNDLFRELRTIAFECDTIEALSFKAGGFNATRYNPPLSNAEVQNQVKGVWRLKQAGKCVIPGSRSAVLPVADIVSLSEYPPALVLGSYLMANHGPGHVFAVSPKGLAGVLSMSHPTIAKARDWLLSKKRLELVKKGRRLRDGVGNVRNEADLYRLLPG